MNKYDLIIIGGGAGAFAAAIKGNQLGVKTLMVNKGLPLGGTCVNVGCVPSKALLHAGEVLHLAKNHGVSGIELEVKNFDFQKIVTDELALVDKMRQEKYEKVLGSLENVTLIEAEAKFVSEAEIEVNDERLIAKKIIIATGSTASVPPIAGITKTGYITHIEALKLDKQPRELTIIGAGPVGLEFAQMFARFGTKVTVLHRGTSVLSNGERELTSRLTEILTKEGIIIKTNVQVKTARKEGDKKILIYMDKGKEESVSSDEILLATGKIPNTQGLGLDKAGVEIDGKQAVKVNQHFQTSQPNIFAIGDVVNLPIRQETTAGREGSLVVENALDNAQNSIDYSVVPWTVFTDPQYASVGFTEDEQMKRFGTCMCKTVSFTDVPKAQIINRTEGLIKMAIHPETKQIMGVHILAPNASELIAEAMMLVKNKNTIDDVINSMPMFPTLSESIKIAALSFNNDITKLSCCV